MCAQLNTQSIIQPFQISMKKGSAVARGGNGGNPGRDIFYFFPANRMMKTANFLCVTGERWALPLGGSCYVF